MLTALVTGGTSGIGAAFATALARDGYGLVLVARNEQRLAETAERLRADHGVEVETISADLADRAAVEVVVERLESTDRPVDLFVNNAGFGVHKSLLSKDTSVHELAIDVMIRAVLVLGGAAGRTMKARGAGTIINVASVAGYI
ncbi:MAG: SDR family NAD(P)-dependent oxidoreductase, partial [Microbacteriaceae bacterium]